MMESNDTSRWSAARPRWQLAPAGFGGGGAATHGPAEGRSIPQQRHHSPLPTPHFRRPKAGLSAFTLIELLVVMGIMLVLMGLVLVTLRMTTAAAKAGRTENIIALIHNACAVAATEGQSAPLSEHPLAGSSAQRFDRPQFYRSDAARWTWDATLRRWHEPTAPQPVSTALPTGGQVLAGPGLGQIQPADESRLLLPSDVYTGSQGGSGDSMVPGLYGLRRDQLRVLGSSLADVTRILHLPAPVPGGPYADPDTGLLLAPYDNDRYPYSQWLEMPGYHVDFWGGATRARNASSGAWNRRVEYGGEGGDVARSFDAFLGAGLKEQLAKLGALKAPPHDDVYARPEAFAHHGLVYREPGGDTAQLWQPGSLRENGRFLRYRLRGAGLYDGWGVELLASRGPGGVLVLTSAGRDGSFRWHPGPDGRFQTEPTASSASGDDRDASGDNIQR